MYVPRFNVLEDGEDLRGLVEAVGTAELITVGADGYPAATLLPVLWPGDRLVMHMARGNPHWRGITPGSPGLAVVTGPQAYISPAWYPSKAEHGRVVPTWNYSAIQFTGRVTVHDDPAWLLDAVTLLTEHHESRRAEPWAVADAPERFVEKQLKAIVGIEFVIEKVEGKAKLSQNRSAEDFTGVVDGLTAEGGDREHEVAEQMRFYQQEDLSETTDQVKDPDLG